MKRKRRSQQWHKEQNSDVYVKQAREEGYRSRAAYKLLEINKKYNLLQAGDKVLDLGAAPGGWSQVAKNIVGKNGMVVAVDRLKMKPIEGVQFIEGDITDDELLTEVMSVEDSSQFDLVISDIAPNLSGIPVSDQARAIMLADLVYEVAQMRLRLGGHLIIKLFQGAGFDEFVLCLKKSFDKVMMFKPKSSRAKSNEVYCIAKSYNKNEVE